MIGSGAELYCIGVFSVKLGGDEEAKGGRKNIRV
jgi:hypothetical protein